jgi:chromosome segregation ATPase
MQATHNYQQQQTTCGTTDAARIRKRSLSLSGSSGGSGVAKIATASMRNLNKYRERDLPEVANKVNDLWMLCNTAVKDAEQESQHTVEKYLKKLHDRSQRIRRYLETIDVQTQAIQSLEADNQDLTNRVTRLESELRDYSDLVPKLRDKCWGMQETVDSALKEQLEQRQLHSQYRKSTQEAIGELRAEKQREQASREIVESQLAAVREQMKEKVCQVEMLSKEECRRSKCSLTPGVSGDCHG